MPPGTSRQNKEVVESDAFQKYNKALAFIKNKEHESAEKSLKELLLHPYFNFDDATFSTADFFNDPAVKLTTSIYKNLGKVHENTANYDEALECYLEAVSSDKTDITTWFNIANVAIKKVNYTLACDSLKECLNINPSFWPSIDTLICLLYALGDYLSCLHLIQHSLSLNSNFQRALCVKAQIETEDPFLFKNFNWKQGLFDLKPDDSVSEKELQFPRELREKDQQAKKQSLSTKTDPILFIRELSTEDPLADLGIAICELFVKSKEGDISLFCPVDFSQCNIDSILEENVCKEQSTPKEECMKELNNDLPLLDPIISIDQDQTEEKIAREAEKREGHRRSKRVQDLLVETNDPLEVLASQLESWIPESIRFYSEKSTLKSTLPKEVEENAIHDKMTSKLDEYELLHKITDVKDSPFLLVPLMKNYCNLLSSHYYFKWSRTVIKAFLNVYFSYRQYEALPNILQSFEEHDTEENILTLMCAFEFIVNYNLFPGVMLEDQYFHDIKDLITESSLDKDQEFLKIANQHTKIKGMFKSSELYDSFQLRFAWAYCLYEEKLSNIKCSLEYVKICVVKLQDTALEELILANHPVSRISKQSLEKKRVHLAEIQDKEDVANLFKDKKYSRVVELLKPMLDETNNELDTESDQIPMRHKNLLILLESLKKLSMMNSCLKCAELLLHELVPFLRFTDTCKSLLTKIFKSFYTSLQDCTVSSGEINYGRVMNNIVKVILKFFETFLREETDDFTTKDYPIERALMIYHSLIDKFITDGLSGPEIVNHNIAKIQSLTLCHEILGEHGICSVNNGVFMLYIIDCCGRFKSQNVFIEDAHNLMEQALFCHIGHPGTGSKRSKKNRVDHGVSNVQLTLELAKKIYNFYEPDQLYNPMEKTKHISADTFDLMTQTVGLFETDLTKTETFLLIKMSMDQDKIASYEGLEVSLEISNFRDIFYLCGDYLWKYDEFVQAVDWFVCDLTINPSRIQSWLCLGLCWLSIAEDRFNHAQSDLKVVVESIAPKAVLCFDHYMSKSTTAFDVASEYSIFLYTIASFYNQVAGALADNVPVIQQIDLKRITLITKAKEVLLKGIEPAKPNNWIKSFLLGKITEKLDGKDMIWLDHYLAALNHLQDYHHLLSKKVNTSSPTEYSMESFELIFRISYSVYKRCNENHEILKDSDKKEKILKCLKQILQLMCCDYDVKADDVPSIAKLVSAVLEECFSKWPEHYKIRNALCKMIHDSDSPTSDNFLRAKSLMLQDSSNSSGMFLFTRKNLFLGIWRIPVDTVDRPGGFFRHMRKSLSLIIASLTHCKDISNLIKLFENMVKTADQLNNFVGDVTQFLQTTLTQFDTLLRCRVSEYCSSPAKHTTEHSIKLLKLCIKVKDIHATSNIDTKPVDEAMLVVLKLFKLTVPQQIALCDPRIMDNTNTLYDTANNLINDFEQVQKMTALLELEKQKKKDVETENSVSVPLLISSTGTNLSPDTSNTDPMPRIDQKKAKETDKIVVNDAAKTAVRQAVATFITQMAEKNQTKGNANVSQILSIINNSVKSKENSTKIRELLLKAVNKETPNVCSKPSTTIPSTSVGQNPGATGTAKTVSIASLKTAIPKLQKTLSAMPRTVSGVTNLNTTAEDVKDATENSPSSPKHAKSSSEPLFQSIEQESAITVNRISLIPEKSVSKSVQEKENASNSDKDKERLIKDTTYVSSVCNLKDNKQDVIPENTHLSTLNDVSSSPLSASPLVKSNTTQAALSEQPLVTTSKLLVSTSPNSTVTSASPPSPCKRKHSSSSAMPGSVSDSDSDEDAMPSLDDVPAPETTSAKTPDQFRAMPSLNIARVNDTCPVIPSSSLPRLNPPMLIKKEPTPPPTAMNNTPLNIHSPPPMYCRASNNKDGIHSSPRCESITQQPSEDIKPPTPIVFPVSGDTSRLALTPAQLLALNVPNKKISKATKPKKERPPRKRKIKENVQVKKREKKRKIDKIQTLHQFEFPVVEKTLDKSVNMYGNSQAISENPMLYRRGISEVHPSTSSQPFFRQTSEPILQHGLPYNNNIPKRKNSDEVIYKPDDYFTGSAAPQLDSPNKAGFSDSPYSNQSSMLLSPGSDHTMFSPTSSENLSSDHLIEDDSQLENLDLGILNELDGCDLTDEQERLRHAAAKPKRGRKPKDPNKPKAPPRKRKPKPKAGLAQVNGTFSDQPQNNQFNSPNSFQFQKQEAQFMGSGVNNGSPNKFYYYPGNEVAYPPTNASKVAMIPPSLQPQTVQQPSPLELTQCSNVLPQVSPPCQYTSENASYVQSAPIVAAPLSHFSPEQPTPATKISFPNQYSPVRPFDASAYGGPGNSLPKQEPLDPAGIVKESETDQAIRMNQSGGFGMQAQYPVTQPYNSEIYPSSLYPDHSFNASTSQIPPSGHPTNNFSNQYQNFRNF